LPRVDLLKLDIGGMESEALHGALQTIKRCRPIFLVESVKTGAERLRIFLDEHGYKVVNAGINILAIHRSDPVVSELQVPDLPGQ